MRSDTPTSSAPREPAADSAQHWLLPALALALIFGPPAGLGRAQDPNVNLAPQRTLPTLATPADAKLPSLFLVGDSTVRNGRGDGANGQLGWGEPLVSFFETSRRSSVPRLVDTADAFGAKRRGASRLGTVLH